MNSLTLLQPTDCHIHLRDGTALQHTVADAAGQFAQAILMPNLNPPLNNLEEVIAYHQRVVDCIPQGLSFTPWMTLYLQDNMDPPLLQKAKESGLVRGVKLYPKGATTHSSQGVAELRRLDPIFAVLEEIQLPLLIHGEVTDPEVDIFDREARFIDRELTRIRIQFPELPVILEHITTEEAVQFIEAQAGPVAATITPHHLLLNRNHLLVGGIHPHHYCLPVLKRNTHQEALLKAATSGNARFFLGTDSAPHAIHHKESACGCAGIYNAFHAIELYAEAFASLNALDQLENFASVHGPRFYGLPIPTQTITLYQEPWDVPLTRPFGDTTVKPLFAGEKLQWKKKTNP